MEKLYSSWSHTSESQSDSIEFESTNDLNDSCMDLEILSNELYKRFRNLIRWTSDSMNETYHDNEFIILDPLEVAKRFAIRRNKPFSLNYHKFNRILRYYYNKKKILNKINGKPNTFSFRIDITPYVSKYKFTDLQLHKIA
ncbi:unnamed protein product [Brachionus calyciflorus]|uniref:ETS domain-containing protein n=1 Tax=Brachionus calyciflorus TaxID=104777 RepID=A0A814CSN0_9BILA|nr:unnamed protein product [Brachionus calyciflorus]